MYNKLLKKVVNAVKYKIVLEKQRLKYFDFKILGSLRSNKTYSISEITYLLTYIACLSNLLASFAVDLTYCINVDKFSRVNKRIIKVLFN